jgi:tripartite-type tricarboxylate transporter receptor subunit TctC
MLDVPGAGRWLRIASGGITLWLFSFSALGSEAYPVRPIRLILGSAVGSGSDVVSRVLSARLAENMGQPVVVDNRPGAAGLIGAEIVSKAAPDGYTIWIATLTQHLSSTIHKKLLLESAFEPIGLLANTPFMIVTHSGIPPKTIEELIAYAKARPGQLMFGSSGTGGSLHICLEVFQSMAGLNMRHVPYKGSAMAITDLMSGEIHLSCPPVAAMTPFLKNARLRVLGVTTKEETALAPGYPPVSQSLPGYAFPGWYGALMPLKAPKHIVSRLHQEFARTVNAPDMRDRLLKVGVEPATSTPDEFRVFLQKESQRMELVMRNAGVQGN